MPKKNKADAMEYYAKAVNGALVKARYDLIDALEMFVRCVSQDEDVKAAMRQRPPTRRKSHARKP